MASAGERTCFCEFLRAPARSGLGDSDADVAHWPVWSSAWGKKVGLRGTEVTLAREVTDAETETFWFPYEDVMNPLNNGETLRSDMVIRFDDGSPAGILYDIAAIFPDEVKREEVRVITTRKKLPS